VSTIIDGPYAGAMGRFGPLIATLQSQLQGYDFAVENTGGHIYCLFIRDAKVVADVNSGHPPYPPDRCVVFSDELDARDPGNTHPWFPASFARYSDWADPTDVADREILYADGTDGQPDIDYRTLFVSLIAVWAAPYIREWFEGDCGVAGCPASRTTDAGGDHDHGHLHERARPPMPL